MKHVEKNMYFPSFALPRKRHFTRRKKEGLGGRRGRGDRETVEIVPFTFFWRYSITLPGNTFLSNRFRSKRKCSSECFDPRADNNSCNARNFLPFELLLLLRETDSRVGTKKRERGKIKSPPIPCRHVAFISRPRPLAGKYRNVRVTGRCQVITYFTGSFLRWLATFWQPRYKGRRKI